ncbi:hypothetical protein [Mycobacterium uberis]|uniref:hypothetical protein n=1 Tax=Mycobacterium uberis TaxID=2162698 RepID=UPI001FB295E4|nr:hypothetical protein [Mycobacterium uberis]
MVWVEVGGCKRHYLRERLPAISLALEGEATSARPVGLVVASRQITVLAVPIAGVQFTQVVLTTTGLAMVGLIMVCKPSLAVV